jgi:hypothetical protein
MSLEDLTGSNKFIDDLINTNPVGATDGKSEGDDHLRGIKNVLLNTFPNLTGIVTASQTQLNYTAISTPGVQEASKAIVVDANINQGVAKVTELHIGATGNETQVTSSSDELNYNDLTTGPGTQEASKAVVADSNVNTGVSKVTELYVGVSGSEVQMVPEASANAPVIRDSNGDFAANKITANEITADLIGNADTADSLNAAVNTSNDGVGYVISVESEIITLDLGDVTSGDIFFVNAAVNGSVSTGCILKTRLDKSSGTSTGYFINPNRDTEGIVTSDLYSGSGAAETSLAGFYVVTGSGTLTLGWSLSPTTPFTAAANKTQMGSVQIKDA